MKSSLDSSIKYIKTDILVIGAGAYTMPKHFKNYYKDTDVSVVELDPEMISVGNAFFDLEKYNIKTIVGDAKVVINKNEEKYDVIFGDAYNSFISVPWYLLTKEELMENLAITSKFVDQRRIARLFAKTRLPSFIPKLMGKLYRHRWDRENFKMTWDLKFVEWFINKQVNIFTN